ncbi:hypothetical protein pEaSNUABM19_00580 [Erwinia phage pEa_SNUABM_19]|nr:hypothetical protein pEaSNUABM19_00580 [Erwinia phage pEa_SNUABM_19]
MLPFPIISNTNSRYKPIEPLLNGVTDTLYFINKRVFVRGRYWSNAPVSTAWFEQTPAGESVDAVFTGQYITYMLCYASNKIYGYGSDNSFWGMTGSSYQKLDLTSQFITAGITNISDIVSIKSAAFQSACVLLKNGDLYFIGNNASYQFGTTVSSYSTLTKTLSSVQEVGYAYGTGSSGMCTYAKMMDGSYQACGAVSATGIPMNATDSTKRIWTSAPFLSGVKSFSVGGKHLNYIDSNDDLYFIGNSSQAQAGNNNTGNVYYSDPHLMASNVLSAVDSEYNTYYVLKSDPNTLWFAGINSYSSLSTTGSTAIVPVFTSYTFPTTISDYSDNIRAGMLIINLIDNTKYASGYSADGRLGSTITNVVLGSRQTSFPSV